MFFQKKNVNINDDNITINDDNIVINDVMQNILEITNRIFPKIEYQNIFYNNTSHNTIFSLEHNSQFV